MASGDIEYSALIKEILRRKTKWLPFLVRCIVVYNWFYDEVIHKRILKLFVKKEQRKYLADGWAEIVGSYAEGTCVTGSDVDFIQRWWPVYCSPREFPNDVKSGLLVFTDDERIPPGCCWLRLYETTRNEIPRVTNGLEWFLSKGYKPDPIRCTAKVVDGHTHYSFRSNVDKSALVCYAPAMVLREDGNVYFSRAAYMGYHMKTGITVSPAINRVLPRWSSHGPAFTQKYFGLFNIDVVHALHCSSTWPSCAQEWKSRRRRFQWPSAALQEDIVNSGFDVVPIASKVNLYHGRGLRMADIIS